jgi:hypothetical protein
MTTPEELLHAAPADAVEAERRYQELTNGSGLHDLVARLVENGDTAALRTLLEGRAPLHELLDQYADPYGRPAGSLGRPYRDGEAAHTHAARALAAAGLAAAGHDGAAMAEIAGRWHQHCRSSSDVAGGAEIATTFAAVVASLTGNLPRQRAVAVRVLFDRAGEHRSAELRLIRAPGLPSGVAPRPPSMTLFTGDEDFQSSLLMAYQQTRTAGGAVLWSLHAADGPVHHVVGASLGAAFAVAFDELSRRRRLTAWYRLRRLPPQTYVVGRLLPSGALGSVTGYDAKAQGLGHRSRLIVPAADVASVPDTAGVVKGVTTWQAAAKAARRFDRWAVTRLVVALAVLAGSVAGVYAAKAENARERSELVATAGRVADEARRLVVGGDGTGLLLAMASDDIAAAAGRTTTVFEDLSQDKGTLVHIYRPERGGYRNAVLSPDGRLAVIATDVGLVQLIDTRTTEVLWTRTYPPGFQLSANQTRVTAVAFSEDGAKAAVGTSDRKITVLGQREGAWLPVLTMTLDGVSKRGRLGEPTSVEALALAGDELYAAGPDGVTRYSLDDGRLRGRCAAAGGAADLHIVGDDAILVHTNRIDRIAVPACRKKRLWTASGDVEYAGVTTGESGALVAAATSEARLLALWPDGRSTTLASAGPYSNVRIMNTNRGVRVTAATSRTVEDGTFVWDADDNSRIGGWRGYGDLVVGGEHYMWLHDGAAELHSSGSDSFPAIGVFDQPNPYKVRWAGRHLLISTFAGVLYALPEVRERQGADRVSLVAAADKVDVDAVTGDPGGSLAAAIVRTGQPDRQLRVWELPSGRSVAFPQPAGDSPNDVRFVGGDLHVAYRSGMVRVWRSSPSGWVLRREAPLGGAIVAMRETPDGGRLVVVSVVDDQDGPFLITVLDAASLAVVQQREERGPVGVAGLDVLDDERILLAYGAGTVLFLGSDLSEQHRTTAEKATYIFEATYVPGMDQALVSARLRPYVFDTGSYAQISDLYWGHAGGVSSADVSPDGAVLAAANLYRGDVSLWPLHVAERRARACRAIGRDLTTQEWRTYIGDSRPYQPVCPQGRPETSRQASPAPEPVTVSAERIGPYRIGMTLAEVRAAADVALDHDEHCGFYTFRGSESFGVGDGPTFFFDDAGRLAGMLVGATVFAREVRTEDGVRLGAPLADLRDRYGARLLPSAGDAEPNTVWVESGAGTTLAFDLDQDRRVNGFRVGSEPFVTSSEFCG